MRVCGPGWKRGRGREGRGKREGEGEGEGRGVGRGERVGRMRVGSRFAMHREKEATSEGRYSEGNEIQP